MLRRAAPNRDRQPRDPRLGLRHTHERDVLDGKSARNVRLAHGLSPFLRVTHGFDQIPGQTDALGDKLVALMCHTQTATSGRGARAGERAPGRATADMPISGAGAPGAR